MKKRALLLGATGLVGRAAAGHLEEDYQIIPAAGRCAPPHGYGTSIVYFAPFCKR